MKSAILLAMLGILISAALCQAVCEEALVLATYNTITSDHLDQRLASTVTMSEWDTVKHEASADAVIYGVPMGASYSDYHQRAVNNASSMSTSLTHDQATNIKWTGLDAQAGNAYSRCQDVQVLSLPGLHLTVKTATTTDIALMVTWRPQGKQAEITIAPTWLGVSAVVAATLPKEITSGSIPIVVDRPQRQMTLAVSFPGFGESVTLEPLQRVEPASRISLTPQPPCTRVDQNGKCLTCLMNVTVNGSKGATQFFSCPNMAAGPKEATFRGTPFISSASELGATVAVRLKEYTGPLSATTEEMVRWLETHKIERGENDGRQVQNHGPGDHLDTWQPQTAIVWGEGSNWALTITYCNNGTGSGEISGCNTQSNATVSIYMKP